MLTLPHIETARTRLTVLIPEQAELMLDFYPHFYLHNRAHLALWEARRDEACYTPDHWCQQPRDGYRAYISQVTPTICVRHIPLLRKACKIAP